MNPFRNGRAFEAIVAERLQTLKHRDTPIQVLGTAGASHGPDIRFKIGEIACALEAKTTGAFEGGQKQFQFVGNTLRLPEGSFHSQLLGTHTPFQGRIPPFCGRGAIPWDEWRPVQQTFKDEILPIDGLNTLGDYYRLQGSAYIQIENYGLYRTGEEDPFELGAPLIQCRTELRIRCKPHTSRAIPLVKLSVTCAIKYDKRSLTRSPLCLMDPAKMPVEISLV